MHLTSKQIELMTIIGSGNPDGTAVDLDQILERLSYHPTKQSLQFSIRALIARDLIKKDPAEKRRGRMRTVISLTETGKVMNGMAKGNGPSFVSEVVDDELLEEISEFLED